MRRPRSHTIETESENIFRSSLPNEWIIRKIPSDYGVDYEVEIVDLEVVSGNRFWFQLKGTSSIKIRQKKFPIPDYLRERYGNQKKLSVDYIAFNAKPSLLEYALRCSFPLLLGVVDITNPEVYWIPLRNWIETRLEPINANWRNQKTVTVRIPKWNNFSREASRDYYGLRWFAMEPARMNSFATLHTYIHELQNSCRLSGYSIGEGFIDYGEKEELIESLKITKKYLQLTLQEDVLFGDNDLDIFIALYKYPIEKGIISCEQLLKEIPNGIISFETTPLKIFEVINGVETLSRCISYYHECKEKFLLNDPFF